MIGVRARTVELGEPCGLRGQAIVTSVPARGGDFVIITGGS